MSTGIDLIMTDETGGEDTLILTVVALDNPSITTIYTIHFDRIEAGDG